MLHLWQTLLVVSAPASAGGLHQEPGQEDQGPDAGYHPGQPTLRYRRLKNQSVRSSIITFKQHPLPLCQYVCLLNLL